jgi:hypothetical protein
MAPSQARGQEVRAARTNLLVDAIADVEAGRRSHDFRTRAAGRRSGHLGLFR